MLNKVNLKVEVKFVKYIWLAFYKLYSSAPCIIIKNVTKYFAPPIDYVCIGPHTSLCTSCSSRVDRISSTVGNSFLPTFFANYPSINHFLDVSPCTNSLWTHFLRRDSCTCPGRWCHKSPWELRHTQERQPNNLVDRVHQPVTPFREGFGFHPTYTNY